MSKLCKNCNITVSDDAKVCPNCGNTLDAPIASDAPLTAENVTGMSNVDTKTQLKGGVDKVKEAANGFVDKMKNDSKTRNTIIGVVAAIILIVVVKIIVFPSPVSVIDTYYSGIQKYNAKKVLSVQHKDIIKKTDEFYEELGGECESALECLKEELSDQKEDGRKIKEFEIDKDYDKLDKDEVEDLADDIEDAYDIKASKVKAARKYNVKVKYKTSDGSKTYKYRVTVVKIGMKWYFLGAELKSAD